MQNATLLKRLFSCVYESLVCIAIAMLVTLVFIGLFGDATTGIKHLLLQGTLWLVIGVYFVQSWVKSGQTVAMRAWKLKLANQNQQAIEYPKAIARYCLATVLMLSGISIVWALFHKDKLFLHDDVLKMHIQQILPK